jgi:hypothetical protein
MGKLPGVRLAERGDGTKRIACFPWCLSNAPASEEQRSRGFFRSSGDGAHEEPHIICSTILIKLWCATFKVAPCGQLLSD